MIKAEDSNEMKRYLLFSWANFYPSGAHYDMKASSDNIHELKHHAVDGDSYYEHHIILDTDERKWIRIDSF
jgi:hypothetical protein